jgi:hypothetical protein
MSDPLGLLTEASAATGPGNDPLGLLAPAEPIQSDVLSWRKAPTATVWDRVKAIFPDDSAAQSARATNALTYSEMLGISPSHAYEYHDEISAQVQDKLATEKIITEKKGIGEAISSGFDTSLIGMMANEKVPKPFESVSQMEKWLHGMTAMGVDLPFFMAGYGIGGANPVSGMAGAFGFTAGLRQVLVDRYTKGEVRDPADWFDRVGNAARETVKGQIIGGFTGGAKVMAPVWLGKMAPGVAPSVGWTAMNELAAMTAAGKLIEGQLPTARDFVDNAAILLTMHAGTSMYQGAKSRIAEVRLKLQESFIETGAHPKEIVNRIASEPIFDPREDILDVIDRVNAEIKAKMPPEPVEKASPEKTKEDTTQAEIVSPERTSQARPEPEASDLHQKRCRGRRTCGKGTTAD